MKKLTFLFILISGFMFSQTFTDLSSVSKFFGSKVENLEKFYKVKPFEKKSNFGKSTIYYKMPNYNISIESNSEDEIINRIDLFQLNIEADIVSDIWYKITTELNKNTAFKIKSTIFKDKTKDFETKELKYNELLTLLRSLDYPEKLIYIVIYEKENISYTISGFENNFIIGISSIEK